MTKWFFLAILGLMMLVFGCNQTIESGGCGDAIVDVSALGYVDAGADANSGIGNIVPSGDALSHGGSLCSADAECASGLCVLSNAPFEASYCFGSDMDGCIAVNESSPFAAQCGSTETIYVCGNYDVSVLGDCESAGSGTHGDEYFCCSKW